MISINIIKNVDQTNKKNFPIHETKPPFSTYIRFTSNIKLNRTTTNSLN